MTKYRVRLSNGRVIGPIEIGQFAELLQKKHIDGTEDYQIYPTGDWLKLAKFPEIESELNQEFSQVKNRDATFIQKISNLKKEIQDLHVGPGEIEVVPTNPAHELTSFPKKFEYEKKTPFSKQDVLNDDEVLTDLVEETEEDTSKEELVEIDSLEENMLDNTIKSKSTSSGQNSENVERTIVNLDTKKYLEELKKEEQEHKAIKDAEEALRLAEEEAKVDLDNDSTQFIDLLALKSDLKKELKSSESELVEEEKVFLKEKKREAAEKLKAEKLRAVKEAEDEDEEEDEGPSKKKNLVIIIAVVALLFVFLFPAKEKKVLKKIVPQSPDIVFPQRFDVPSPPKAAEAHSKAIELLKNPTYLNKIKAAKFLLNSAENQFDNNEALGRLIFVYSELLPESKTLIDDANTIFKLVQIFKTKAVSDPLFASGVALFYLNIDKPYAAVKVVEKFNAVKKNNPTLELFTVYLRALMETGDLIKSKAVSEKLASVEYTKRPLFVTLGLYDYYILISNYEAASNLVVETSKLYPDAVSLLLRRAKLLIYQEDFKSLETVLVKIRELAAEQSKIYYSKYLEFKALESVKTGKIEVATKFFKEALKVHESQELRTRLASLGESTNNEANILITESKSMQFITNSKNQMKKNNWKFAFKDALEATRIAPHFVQAKLYLATLQIKQSLFSEAINELEKLYKDDPHNNEIVFTLMDAYIEAYKFSDIKRMFEITSASEIRNEPKYYSLTAKYYVYKNDFQNAVNWLQLAINKNPLDDYNIYELAKMFIKYSKFDKGKMLLNKAMDLDPAHIDFRITFSQIIYEIDGADAAIGYLYDVLQDFPDNPKALSQIGIFHYRSGEQKYFESIKEKLTKLPHRDTSLYEFLIQAAKLDGKPEIVVENSKKLIELNPGDLRVRLELGKIYMDTNKYKESLVEFKAIEERLETYPKLQLYMSKLYLLTDNNEKAIELAQKEIKSNPSQEDGYILLGDIYRKEKEYIKAEDEYKKAQKINGENVDMLIGLATVNFKKSQYEIALDLFKRARKNEPSRAEIHKLLGDAYRKTSQSSLAIESYKMFLELSPNTKYKDEIDTYIRMME